MSTDLPFKISNNLDKNWIPLNPGIYRRGTVAEKLSIHFLFYMGGIGDYICWMSAVEYTLEQHLHVTINMWVQSHFMPVAKHLFEDRFKDRIIFHNIEGIDKVDRDALFPAFFPHEGTPSGVGMNLVDLGFVYYGNTMPHGKYRNHIRMDVSKIAVPSEVEELIAKKPYVVVTTGHTAKTREWRASGINGVTKYLNTIGVLPVFLGKKDIFKMGEGKNYKADFPDGIDFSAGLDLREKTSVLEAVKIMSDAKVVIGIDNGLLHLAATQSVPIIMGLTITRPQDRELRRPKVPEEAWPKNESIYLTADPRILPCIGCQSKMRYHENQNFSFCYYKDYKCLDRLADPEPWIQALKRYLEPEKK